MLLAIGLKHKISVQSSSTRIGSHEQFRRLEKDSCIPRSVHPYRVRETKQSGTRIHLISTVDPPPSPSTTCLSPGLRLKWSTSEPFFPSNLSETRDFAVANRFPQAFQLANVRTGSELMFELLSTLVLTNMRDPADELRHRWHSTK